MGFIATPQGVEVVLKGQQASVPVVNVFHVDAGVAITPSVLASLVAQFVSWVASNWLDMMHNSYTLNEIIATDISVVSGAQATHVYSTGNVGLVGGDAEAANAALVCSWRTAKTGRSYRGRTYIGALADGALVDAHNVSTSYAAAVAVNMQALLDILATAGAHLCVLSKTFDKVARLAGVLTRIIEIIVDTKIDSQRRRTAN